MAFEVDGVWDRVKEDALEQVEQYYRDLDSQVDAVRTCLLSVSAVLPATDVDDMAGQTMSHVKWLYSDLRERCTVYVYVTGAIPQDGAESMGRCVRGLAMLTVSALQINVTRVQLTTVSECSPLYASPAIDVRV